MIIIWFRAFVHFCFLKKNHRLLATFCSAQLVLLLFSSGSKFIKYSTPSAPKQKQISALFYLFVLLLLCDFNSLFTSINMIAIVCLLHLYPPFSFFFLNCVCVGAVNDSSASKLFVCMCVWVCGSVCMSECVSVSFRHVVLFFFPSSA